MNIPKLMTKRENEVILCCVLEEGRNTIVSSIYDLRLTPIFNKPTYPHMMILLYHHTITP